MLTATPTRVSPLRQVLSYHTPLDPPASGGRQESSAATTLLVRDGRLAAGRSAMPFIGVESAEPAPSLGAGDAFHSDLALHDVSMPERMVIKGPAAVQFLATHGFDAPGRIFAVRELPGGGVIARTGTNEVFLEDGPSGTGCAAIARALGYGGDGVYAAPAPTASMCLSGGRATDVLLETCNVDFREPSADIVMTRVAGVSCMVLYRELDGRPAFQLWFDGTYGHYLASTLLEIVHDRDMD